MRVLIVDMYYPAFLERHYADRPGLAEKPYDVQLASLMARSMGTFDAYSHGLRALNHEAVEIVVNCLPLQLRWAQENGVRLPVRRLGLRVPGIPSVFARDRLLHAIAMAQIDAFRPDVVYTQDLWYFRPSEIRRMQRRGTLVVAQCGSQPPPLDRIAAYDLVTTSFPHFVPRFRASGIDCEHFPLAFDPRVLDRLRATGCPATPDAGREVDVAFVGGIHRPDVHRDGTALLERLCRDLGMQVWGYINDELPPNSAIRRHHHGPVWGLDMYRALARTRIAINRHGDIAESNANNMRLFEATGVGALLVTEAADNLPELFEPGREVVAYEDPDDLIEKSRHYLANPDELQRLARAGQNATLARHTYSARMALLADHLERRLG